MSKKHEKELTGKRSDSVNYSNTRIIQNRHAIIETGNAIELALKKLEEAGNNYEKALIDTINDFASKEIKVFLDIPTGVANDGRVFDKILKEELNFLSGAFSTAEFEFAVEIHRTQARLGIDSAEKMKKLLREVNNFLGSSSIKISYLPKSSNVQWSMFKVKLQKTT